ncbi:PAS domain-containing protein [Haematospirillum sp. H1815]|uniref:methyl-accepting chemotaxis protein n=1 Tax=Haematospirillum sp. H1815 TaxID=2723108 RepID=UPI00143C6BBC|nr:methyl-accepting chemotaxis protein [Haematospirillum sp. H1815]NKD77200.1 PAS domain-containing protein [Haematospirillum sp. H1815]
MFFSRYDNDFIQMLSRATLDALPDAVMIADSETLTIQFANKRSMEILAPLERWLPVPLSSLIGTSIDAFHKNPAHQRALLADPGNLPHRAIVSLGAHKLELKLSAIYDGKGRYVAVCLTWSLATEHLRVETENNARLQMLDLMPVNIILCNKNGIITYTNKKSRETLKKIEHLLPCKAEEVIGKSYDIFHRRPEYQRQIIEKLGDRQHRAVVHVGDEAMDLRVNPVKDHAGAVIGTMVTWSLVTEQERLANMVMELASKVNTISTDLKIQATEGAAAAEETSNQAASVMAAVEQLSVSINEISARLCDAARISHETKEEMRQMLDQVYAMDEASTQIDTVISMIAAIAGQTKVLALNAAIEASRAGFEGKGFAVVAEEVHSLAHQAAESAASVGDRIGLLKDTTKACQDIAHHLMGQVENLSEISAAIAASVEEQSAATSEISGNVAHVCTATDTTSKASSSTLAAARELDQRSGKLEGIIKDLMNMDER